MDYLIKVENVSFNVKCHGSKKLTDCMGNLIFGFNVSESFTIDYEGYKLAPFRITLPKKYNTETYKKLSDVIKFYINQAKKEGA